MNIRIIDELDPEDTAMLQALYSRSAEGVDTHIDKVNKTGSKKFMSSYYVGYGHKSIADCGSTTMFIEGVSLLAAKAIQDWPLYSGQETSTRYIDMSKQEMVIPIEGKLPATIFQRWMDFYTSNQNEVSELVRKRYPIREGEKEETYTQAVKARTFDILRGFLPAGITTQLSWHSNLRQAGDHLNGLIRHPLLEVQIIAQELKEELNKKYPSSGFSDSLAAVGGISNKNSEERAAREEWEKKVASEFTYSVDLKYHVQHPEISMAVSWRSSDTNLTELSKKSRYREIIQTRPRGCVLPHFMSDNGQLTFDFLLDFGSFRDIQRHRNGVCRMPVLNTGWGFEPWYLEQLGDPNNGNTGGLRDKAVKLLSEQSAAIGELEINSIDKQYFVALGYLVPCQITYALPALLYVLELRSNKTVHPTLRRQIHRIIHMFKNEYPEVALHADMSPDDWDVRRGNQTITKL